MSDNEPRDEWNMAYDAGAKTVEDALLERMKRRIDRGDTLDNLPPLLCGALEKCACMLRDITADDYRAEAEELAIATIRAIFHFQPHPINADGTPYVSDAEPEQLAKPAADSNRAVVYCFLNAAEAELEECPFDALTKTEETFAWLRELLATWTV